MRKLGITLLLLCAFLVIPAAPVVKAQPASMTINGYAVIENTGGPLKNGLWAPYVSAISLYVGYPYRFLERMQGVSLEYVKFKSTWRWDFGDHSPWARGTSARHTFDKPGVYKVVVEVYVPYYKMWIIFDGALVHVITGKPGTQPPPTPASLPTAIPTARPDTLANEWAAVQKITYPWDAQGVLSTVDNATGAEALTDSGALGLTAEQFYNYQTRHPAYLMAAIQRFLTPIYRSNAASGYGAFAVESINDQLGLLDVNGLTPQEEADLIVRICTMPLATAVLST